MLDMNVVSRVLLIGAGATVAMDLWQLVLGRLGMPTMNLTMVGRWLGHMPRGRFTHPAIARAAPIAGERLLGWLAHYAIGMAFAGLLVAVAGAGWMRNPTWCAALLLGGLSVAAPLLVMQPAMGAGIASSRTPTPLRNVLRSVVNHLVFGAGLYLSAALLARVCD